MASMEPPLHAPYPPKNAGLGLQPTTSLDSPITSVFLVLFILGAATHMTIFQLNLRRGRKFIMSAMVFGFCMARILACTMRLVWASHPRNVSVAIAAQIFVAVGVIIFFIINVIFVQRLFRASHPQLGWAKWFSLLFKMYYASIIFVIIILITGVIQSFYTLRPGILHNDRILLLFGSTYFAAAAFLPIPLLALRAILPTRGPREDFGEGRFSTKVIILLISSIVLTLGAAFRAGTSYLPRPASDPAWYQSKACFYLFNFTIDFSMVVFYAVMRVDKRFIVPNGSHGPGDYSRPIDKVETGKEAGQCDTSGEEGISTTPRGDVESCLAGEKVEEARVSTATTQSGNENSAPIADMSTKPAEDADGRAMGDREPVEQKNELFEEDKTTAEPTASIEPGNEVATPVAAPVAAPVEVPSSTPAQ